MAHRKPREKVVLWCNFYHFCFKQLASNCWKMIFFKLALFKEMLLISHATTATSASQDVRKSDLWKCFYLRELSFLNVGGFFSDVLSIELWSYAPPTSPLKSRPLFPDQVFVPDTLMSHSLILFITNNNKKHLIFKNQVFFIWKKSDDGNSSIHFRILILWWDS